MKCWTLPDTCTEFLPADNATEIYSNRPGRGTLALYRRPPVRLHVAGMSRAGLAQLLKPSQIGNLRDPLNSELLRHLERSIFITKQGPTPDTPSDDASSRRLQQQRRRRDVGERRRRAARDVQPYRGVGDAAANLTMIWPLWEMGFGDVLANTVLPLGELLRLGRMPTHLAVSGMRHAPLVQQLRPTASAICASERASALLPRCTSRCWGAVHICAPVYTDTRDAWAAQRTLDASAGLVPNLTEVSRSSASSDGGSNGGGSSGGDDSGSRRVSTSLRVLFAARSGRRLVLNVQQLAAACDGSAAWFGSRRTELHCRLLAANATPTTKVWELRRADVLICIWGGDTLHGLHLRHGGAIVEMRHAGFISGWARAGR